MVGMGYLLVLYTVVMQPLVEINETERPIYVKIVHSSGARLRSPEEGLWSIATDWEQEWPARWLHVHPQSVERVGEWALVKGSVFLEGGELFVSDAYRNEKGLIRCTRRFEWRGNEPLQRCTLSVRFLMQGTGPRAVLPGILYHGNPSGAKSGRTPVYQGSPGEAAFFEEHRFPMPFVSFEWKQEDSMLGAALHSLPCPVPYGHRKDQWWSLGIQAHPGHTELALLSGPCASNGQRSVIKAAQSGFVPYPDAWLAIPPHGIIEKTFYLDAYAVSREGAGFQHSTHASLRLFPPAVTPDLPTFKEIIARKLQFAETRWLDTEGAVGYRKYPDKDTIVMGWCGQAEALGYALPVIAPHFGVPYAQDRSQRSLDFLSQAEFYDRGFRTWYFPDQKRWANHEWVSQGQAMLCFAEAIRIARTLPQLNLRPQRWEDFLYRAAQFHANRILAENWAPQSTGEAFFIAPLGRASTLFENQTFLKAAEKAGQLVAQHALNMREPYWGGTLDASCEDKEGAFAALQGFLALYDRTGIPQYLDWAEHALDIVLTYVVVWDIDMPPGRLRNHAFKTRGWTVVSPQNQHIDVYGVLIAPLVYRMGLLKHEDTLKTLALLMFRSCGQLMDPWGSQGEQPQHTQYTQRESVEDIESVRGGYVEDWTVFWITAHFLNAAAQFIELGVPVWE